MLSLASAKLGVALLGVLTLALIPATLLDKYYGLDFANSYVYKSSWFIGLLFLLCVNILAAVLLRIPRNIGGAAAVILAIFLLVPAVFFGDGLSRWFGHYYDRYWFIAAALSLSAVIIAATLKYKLLGFFIAHFGILVLLLGAYQTFLEGIEGQIALVEGEKADSIRLSDWGKFTVSREPMAGNEHARLDMFPFQTGMADWPEGKIYDGWEEQGGVKLKVLKYYGHARADENWIPDKTKNGEPAIRFAIAHADGKTMLESWLAGEPLGGPGIPKIEILQAPVDSMREDFLNPPKSDEDENGVLSVHYDGRMQRIPVSKNIGKRIALENNKIEVEIAKYFANAKPIGTAQFESQGEEPKNPLLDLNIYLPDRKEPLRELAFAEFPTMSLVAMHGGDCPVKLWYHHTSAPAGVDFLRTPDGKLYCRVGRDGKYVSQGEVKEGTSVDIAEKFKLKLLQILPFAKHKVLPQPVLSTPGEKNAGDDAALVEVESGGVKESVWLMRNDPKYGFQWISTPKGNLSIQFGDESIALGFSLKLLKFTRVLNPGRMGDAAFISSVEVVDEARGLDQEREISMNNPLTQDKYTFYQSDCNELSDGRKVSILSVAYDPGRFLKYLGCVMICGGMALKYLTNARIYKSLRESLFQAESSR